MNQDTPAAASHATTHILYGVQPVLCQLLGHEWALTEHAEVKMCAVCDIRGYCPGCTPVAPQGAQPFCCTHHSRQREVQ